MPLRMFGLQGFESRIQAFLGVGFQPFFMFTPKIGEMIPFDEHIVSNGFKPND